MARAGKFEGAGERAHGGVPVAATFLHRRRLDLRLDQSLQTPLTLVCAPAGYGKSLQVASWLSDRHPSSGVWVNVGGTGGRPGPIWDTILRGVDRAVGSDHGLPALFDTAWIAPAQAAAALGDLVAAVGRDMVVVLDDFQAVANPEVNEQLLQLALSSAGRLHVVAVTRHDPPWPLHRMRLGGILTEIRADELEFTVDEIAALFQYLDLPLTAGQAEQLRIRTQGWVAGLRLAAMGAAGAPDPAGYLSEFSGQTGYIADYLMREVFQRLRPQWQDLFKRTCVADLINPELAEWLGAGPRSAESLDELARQNMFIDEIGRGGRRYRVHPLLQDLLRSRIVPASEQLALHRRASAWFAANGEPREAFGHAVAAQEWSAAGDLLGTHVVSWTVRRPPGDLLRRLATIPRDVLLSQPGFAIGAAAAAAMSGRVDDIDDLVSAAVGHIPRVKGRRRERYQYVLRLIEVGSGRWRGDLDGMLRGLRELSIDPATLSGMGLADWSALRMLIINNIGTAEMWAGEDELAFGHLHQVATDHDVGTPILPVLNARAHLAYWYWRFGDLVAAESAAREAVEDFTTVGIPRFPQSVPAYLALAGIYLDRDEIAAARRWHAVAAECATEPHVVLATRTLLARIQAAVGKAYEARDTLVSALAAAAASPVPAALRDEASTILAGYERPITSRPPGDRSPVVPDHAPRVHTIRAQISTSLAEVEAAGSEFAAVRALERAVDTAGPQQFRRPFLDRFTRLRPLLDVLVERGIRHPEFVVDLLARGSRDSPRRPTAPSGYFAPLTERERDILRYLQSSMSTSEIAEILYVSVNTVKTHQRSIYQKLGVGSRREAVRSALELGLV